MVPLVFITPWVFVFSPQPALLSRGGQNEIKKTKPHFNAPANVLPAVENLMGVNLHFSIAVHIAS
jgi:hypothetical protein